MIHPRGYNTHAGYVGFFPDGNWMLFASESDYREFFNEHCSDSQEGVA